MRYNGTTFAKEGEDLVPIKAQTLAHRIRVHPRSSAANKCFSDARFPDGFVKRQPTPKYPKKGENMVSC
jgi:hypothetical protein